MAICSVLWRFADSGFKNYQESYRRIVHAVRIAVNRFPPVARLALIMLCQAMGTGRAVRGDRKSGANGCRGASWSEEADGKELRGALGGKRNLEPRESSFSGQRLPIFLHRLRCGMLISKFSPCILLYITRLFLSLVICTILVLSDSKCLASHNKRENLLSQQVLFFRGRLSPSARAAGYSRQVLIGDDSIAYDRSFA